MNLIREAGKQLGWPIDLGECARIWKGGCIIRAKFLDRIKSAYDRDPALPSLLVEQLTTPVRFAQAASEMIGQGVTTFVEVGPGNVLAGLLKRIDTSVRAISVNDLKSLDAAVNELG